MTNNLLKCRPCLSAQQINCYNTGSNSVLVPGLETANFTFGSTVRLCDAIKTATHFFVVLLNRLLAVPRFGQDSSGVSFFFPAQSDAPYATTGAGKG